MKRGISVLFGLAFLAAPATAQIGNGETGLYMVKPSGNAGVICSSMFNCTLEQTALARGEVVDLFVRGVFQQPFVVAVAPAQPPLCASLPGIHNALMFWPSFTPFFGILDQPDGILACPGGVKRLQFTVPATLPPAVVSWQGLAWSYLGPGEVPTFTVAITTTVR